MAYESVESRFGKSSLGHMRAPSGQQYADSACMYRISSSGAPLEAFHERLHTPFWRGFPAVLLHENSYPNAYRAEPTHILITAPSSKPTSSREAIRGG